MAKFDSAEWPDFTVDGEAEFWFLDNEASTLADACVEAHSYRAAKHAAAFFVELSDDFRDRFIVAFDRVPNVAEELLLRTDFIKAVHAIIHDLLCDEREPKASAEQEFEQKERDIPRPWYL